MDEAMRLRLRDLLYQMPQELAEAYYRDQAVRVAVDTSAHRGSDYQQTMDLVAAALLRSSTAYRKECRRLVETGPLPVFIAETEEG